MATQTISIATANNSLLSMLCPPFKKEYVVDEFNSDLMPFSFFAKGSNLGLGSVR